MKKIPLSILLITFHFFLFSQNLEKLNLSLDSLQKIEFELQAELKNVVNQISVLKSRKEFFIKEEVLPNGINATINARSSSAKLYSNPSSFSDKLVDIPNKSIVKVHETKNTFFKITYNNLIGYIEKRFVEPNDELLKLGVITKSERKSLYYSKGSTTSSYKSSSSSNSSSRKIHTGPRGGKYYINKNGNKTYIKRKN